MEQWMNILPRRAAPDICYSFGLDNVSCKQSTESFNRNDFNRNDKKSVHVNVATVSRLITSHVYIYTFFVIPIKIIPIERFGGLFT